MQNQDPQLHNKRPEDPVSVSQRWSDEVLLREIDSLLAHDAFAGQSAAELSPALAPPSTPVQPKPAPPKPAQPEPAPQSGEPDAAAPAPEPPAGSAAAKPAENVAQPEELPDILFHALRVKTPEPQNLSEPAPEQESAPAPKKKTKPPKPKKQKKPKPEPRPVRTPEEACRAYAAGIGSIGLRIVTAAILELLSVFFTLYADLGWEFLPSLFAGSTIPHLLLILLLLIVALSYSVFTETVRALAGGEFPQDVLLSLAALFALIDSFSAASEGRTPFTSAVGLLLLLRMWGCFNRQTALLGTVRMLRDSKPAVGIAELQLPSGKRRGVARAKPDAGEFMEQLEARDDVRRVMGVYTPLAVLLCLAGSAFLATRTRCGYFWTGTLLLLGGVPTASLLCSERVFHLIARRLAAKKAALCGWHGAAVFGGEHTVLVTDRDLFPEGSLSLNGFKVYQGSTERLIAFAAAAARCTGGALHPLFDELLDAHSGRHYSVDNFRFYDSGGVGAQIADDVVLLGSLDFMQRMGVHMDGGSKVRQAAYLSLNGELAAVFAVKYNAPDTVKQGLLTAARSRHFRIVLATRTFFATPEFLKGKFGLPPESVSYPPVRDRLQLSGGKLKKTGAQGALLFKDSFLGFAETVAAGRMLRTAGRTAALLSLGSGLVGMGLMAVLALLPATETATGLNLLLYVLAWLVPTLIVCLWPKRL